RQRDARSEPDAARDRAGGRARAGPRQAPRRRASAPPAAAGAAGDPAAPGGRAAATPGAANRHHAAARWREARAPPHRSQQPLRGGSMMAQPLPRRSPRMLRLLVGLGLALVLSASAGSARAQADGSGTRE